MNGHLITIRTDGAIMTEPLSGAPHFTELQAIVGGHIEVVPHFNRLKGAPCVAFCNEEGKVNNLPVNETAQALWLAACNCDLRGDYLVGNIAVVIGDDELMASL